MRSSSRRRAVADSGEFPDDRPCRVSFQALGPALGARRPALIPAIRARASSRSSRCERRAMERCVCFYGIDSTGVNATFGSLCPRRVESGRGPTAAGTGCWCPRQRPLPAPVSALFRAPQDIRATGGSVAARGIHSSVVEATIGSFGRRRQCQQLYCGACAPSRTPRTRLLERRLPPPRCPPSLNLPVHRPCPHFVSPGCSSALAAYHPRRRRRARALLFIDLVSTRADAGTRARLVALLEAAAPELSATPVRPRQPLWSCRASAPSRRGDHGDRHRAQVRLQGVPPPRARIEYGSNPVRMLGGLLRR